MPPRTLIRVDLPAPFSPRSATTSPRLTSKLTPFSACVPPNDLATFSKRRIPPCAKSRSSPIREPYFFVAALVKLWNCGPRLRAPLLLRHRDLEPLLGRDQVIVVVIAEVDLHPLYSAGEGVPAWPVVG